jgi:hypothetical protein
MTVSREPNTMMKVVILTHNYRVVGRVYVKKGARLTDAVCQAGFINVSRDEIEIILPADEVDCECEDMGSLGTWLLERRHDADDEAQELDLNVE